MDYTFLLLKFSWFLLLLSTFTLSVPVEQDTYIYKRSAEIEEGSGEGDLVNTTNTRIVNDPPLENSTNKSIVVEKLDKVDNVGANLVSNAQNIFGSFINIASNLFDIKTKATVKGIGAASRTANTLAKSDTAGKLRDAGENAAKVAGEGARRLGETVVVGGKIIGEGVSKASVVAAPVVLGAAKATATGVEKLTRLKICLFICPLRKEEEKDNCRKKNCGKIDRSDNLDYYDGDFRGDWN